MADPISALAERLLEALVGNPPHVVGISGAVAVGKSTVAEQLAADLATCGRRPQVIATDAFLHPNSVLSDRGLTFRKGFPETFDLDAMISFLGEIRSGSSRVELPIYSHTTYDILPGERSVIEDADLVLLEGVITLQPPIVDAVDVPIYVDADESDVRGWFVERFLALTAGARRDPESFYRMFADMSAGEVRAIAESTWESINGVNLSEHILPSRERAMFVVEKAADHSIRRVRGPGD